MKRALSHELFERAKRLMPGGVNSPVRSFRSVDSDPFIVSHGAGAYLVDVDGNSYVDYICSWGPLVLGHAYPEVVEALSIQAAKGTSYGACCKVEGDLAEKIISLVPSLEMIRFVNSGTEAGMSVIRLARGFTKRSKLIKFSGCYHGHVDSMLVNAGSGVATLGIPACSGVLESTSRDTLTAQYNNLEGVEKLFKEFPNDIAAVLLEPVVGNAGFILPEKSFLTGLRDITQRYGALLVFDEVMTGFRVDLGCAQGLYGITPDLTLLGKVIGGGLPVGAFGGRRDIMERLAPLGEVYQAGTLSGNPLAMTAGLVTLNSWTKGDTFKRASKVAEAVVQTLKSSASEVGIPLTAASLGTMFGFFFHPGPVRNYEEAKSSNGEIFKRFFHLMLEEGIYLAPSQFEAGFVSVMHEGEPLRRTVDAIRKVMPRLL